MLGSIVGYRYYVCNGVYRLILVLRAVGVAYFLFSLIRFSRLLILSLKRLVGKGFSLDAFYYCGEKKFFFRCFACLE